MATMTLEQADATTETHEVAALPDGLRPEAHKW